MLNIPTPWTTAGRATINRRDFLRGASAMAVVPSFLWGTSAPDLVLIMMADLHSGYAYTAALLASVRSIIASSPNSVIRIIVNGDVFESGNFLSSMTTPPGTIDFSMIDAFAGLAPTIVTIGNHDGDIFDPQVFVSSMNALSAKHGSDLTLVSDLGDTRKNNALYTGSAVTSFMANGNQVMVTSIGTPGNSYANNALYYRPDPGTYAAAQFPAVYKSTGFHLALVHAGFMQDQAVLPSLTPPFLLQGGHDHLRFTQPLANGQGMHVHAGYWSNGLAVAGINFSGNGSVNMRVRQIQLTRASPADAALAAMIGTARATLLNATNNPLVGTSSQSYDLDSAVLKAVDVVRQAASADVGFLSHTTFGDGLPAGPVDKLALNAFVRFPGGFKTGMVSGATLINQVLPITNQYGNFPYAQRTGDFLYTTATAASIDPSKMYRCIVNSFAASASYFGSPVPPFVDGTVDTSIASLELRTLVSAALSSGVF
jgi:2',3'-cyclic-nucleotide 2'-phosphodiesterase (5'-nucleotidase family)